MILYQKIVYIYDNNFYDRINQLNSCLKKIIADNENYCRLSKLIKIQ